MFTGNNTVALPYKSGWINFVGMNIMVFLVLTCIITLAGFWTLSRQVTFWWLVSGQVCFHSWLIKMFVGWTWCVFFHIHTNGGFRYMKQQHLIDVTEVFRNLKVEKKFRIIKLGFYVIFFILVVFRYVLHLVHKYHCSLYWGVSFMLHYFLSVYFNGVTF